MPRLEEQEPRPLPRLYLLYHELGSDRSRYTYTTEVGLFERHLELYVKLRESRSSALWPELTFDDGHVSNYDLAAPALQSRGLTARFFITAGWTGKRLDCMGWAELRSLQEAGHSIGAHGWTHKLLTHCDATELRMELSQSRLTLEDRLGTPVTTMSLPGGRYNRRVLAACREAGYTQIYTSAPLAEPLPLGETVGRLNILGEMQPDWLARLFQPDGAVLCSLQRRYRRKRAVQRMLGDRMYERLWALVNRRQPEAAGDGEGAR